MEGPCQQILTYKGASPPARTIDKHIRSLGSNEKDSSSDGHTLTSRIDCSCNDRHQHRGMLISISSRNTCPQELDCPAPLSNSSAAQIATRWRDGSRVRSPDPGWDTHCPAQRLSWPACLAFLLGHHLFCLCQGTADHPEVLCAAAGSRQAIDRFRSRYRLGG